MGNDEDMEKALDKLNAQLVTNYSYIAKKIQY
jgi:hypothetical protein